jgi:flagellar motor switch protein FliN
VSTDDMVDPGTRFDPVPAREPEGDLGPLGRLPRLTSRQVRLDERLARAMLTGSSPAGWIGLDDLTGIVASAGRPEVLWRGSGLGRPGLVAQLVWPRLGTGVGIGIETPIAHAVVDRMLGFERFDAETRLQLTPVEWGILTFVLARGLERLGDRPGPLGPWDLVLDRVGPDPFDARGLGPIVTIRWPLRVGPASGWARLWLPESLVARVLATDPRSPGAPVPDVSTVRRLGELASVWRAEAGMVELSRGLRMLRSGGVHPLVGSHLRGTPRNLAGPVALALDLARQDGRRWFPTEPVPYSGSSRLTLTALLQRDDTPREALALDPTPSGLSPAGIDPSDVPVTLVVELGRVNLTLRRLADLKPGDVIELGRHSREPVELTSGGRLVARGELVQIDTELGVRVTSVFL